MIKFLDLKKINSKYQSELIEASKRVIKSGYFLMGEELKNFEKKYSKFCNSSNCIGVSNGLDALRLIFRAYIEIGVMKRGDEVIVPVNTFIASVLAITDNNLVPVFVEPKDSYNIDSDKMKKLLPKKLKQFLLYICTGRFQ